MTDYTKFRTYKHYNILNQIIENVGESKDGKTVCETFDSVYRQFVVYGVIIDETTRAKVKSGLASWVDSIEDIFTILTPLQKHWMYIHILRRHPLSRNYIPKKLLEIIEV